MNPSLRINGSMLRLGWMILVLWVTACGQVQPEGAAPQAASVTSSVPTVAYSPTALPIPTSLPKPTPIHQPESQTMSLHMARAEAQPQITSYVAYRVKIDDTLERISALGGSKPDLLMRYNRLTDPPQPGRELLIPRLAGQTSELTKTYMLVTQGNTQKRWVALTFDCGGINPNTDTLLDTLRENNMKVSFFLHGDSILHNPGLLRRMVREGHEIANHSYSHPDFTKLTPQEMRDELDKTERVIKDILGEQATTRPYVRLPYGASNRQVIETVVSHGYLPIHWTIDSYDSHGKRRSPTEIADIVDNQLTEEQVPGAIVLMHCMDRSIAAVPQILETFHKRKIEVHTVTDVLEP